MIFCPHCGAANTDGVKFCNSCGAELTAAPHPTPQPQPAARKKFCTHCGKELANEAVICPGCGCAVPNPSAESQSAAPNMKFCSHCGRRIAGDAVVCVYCGCAVGGAPVAGTTDPGGLVMSLSEKVKTNGIIWICIAALQLLLGIFVNWVLLIIGVLNLVSAIGDLNYSKTVLQNPTGIVKKFEPLAGPIITLIYNFIFGGVIGIIGSIYYLAAIRSFVMNNKAAFLQYDTATFF